MCGKMQIITARRCRELRPKAHYVSTEEGVHFDTPSSIKKTIYYYLC